MILPLLGSVHRFEVPSSCRFAPFTGLAKRRPLRSVVASDDRVALQGGGAVTWAVDNPEHLAAVGRAGAPPSDFESFFTNETWAWIWASWSADRISAGDAVPYHLYRLADAVLRGAGVA